jgi:ribonuclease HI
LQTNFCQAQSPSLLKILRYTQFMLHISIYTDGSCLGNPGPGGWAALIRLAQGTQKKEKRIQGGAAHTTNNRMELQAVIEALRFLHEKKIDIDIPVAVYSDSSWVINTLTQGWKRKANLDLWAELEPLIAHRSIEWHWVKGHAGHAENEDCDQRAQKEAHKA